MEEQEKKERDKEREKKEQEKELRRRSSRKSRRRGSSRKSRRGNKGDNRQEEQQQGTPAGKVKEERREKRLAVGKP